MREFGFRLEDFTVYASLLSLPTAAQDSLCDVLGYTFTAGLSPARYAKLFLAHNYEELSHAYIKSCWDPFAAKIAASAFQQDDVIRLRNSESIALAA